MTDYHMSPIDGRPLSKALQVWAHNLCNTLHPDDQINMTGWLSIDGEFLVSCAACKNTVYRMYERMIEDAKTDDSQGNQR